MFVIANASCMLLRLRIGPNWKFNDKSKSRSNIGMTNIMHQTDIQYILCMYDVKCKCTNVVYHNVFLKAPFISSLDLLLELLLDPSLAAGRYSHRAYRT